MAKISSIKGRIIYNSRGSKTIELDVKSNDVYGRVCAPSGASVGRHEAASFHNGNPEESLKILQNNSHKFIGLESQDLKGIHNIIKEIDNHSNNYSNIGGSIAFALTIAAMELTAKSSKKELFQVISKKDNFKFPYPIGNILGGGAHAGPGTPDIQEILVCATGAKTIRDAIDINLQVHKELRNILSIRDPNFTNGRGDEGGWAPKIDNEEALNVSAKACENLGFTLGKEVSLGVDFASSTQWNNKRQKYVYDRAGFENTSSEQVDFASSIIKRYKLIYVEDAVHEDAFMDMAELTAKFPDTMIAGDDLTVTNKDILAKASSLKSCNAAVLKVNQAGSLHDALEFADIADQNNIKLITSHRSGESIDSHISHIGIATGSKLLKVGVVGGERVAKLNELLRLSEEEEESNLIYGMAEI